MRSTIARIVTVLLLGPALGVLAPSSPSATAAGEPGWSGTIEETLVYTSTGAATFRAEMHFSAVIEDPEGDGTSVAHITFDRFEALQDGCGAWFGTPPPTFTETATVVNVPGHGYHLALGDGTPNGVAYTNFYGCKEGGPQDEFPTSNPMKYIGAYGCGDDGAGGTTTSPRLVPLGTPTDGGTHFGPTATRTCSGPPCYIEDDPSLTCAATIDATVDLDGPGTGLLTLTTTKPTIGGTPKVGETLKAVAQGWTDGTAFTYQWFANGSRLRGETGRKLKVTKSLKGDKVSVKVTGSQDGYRSATRTSDTVRIR